MKYLLTAMAWIFALVCAAGAAQEWSRAHALADRAAATAAHARPGVRDTPLEPADYQAIQKQMPVFGTVQLAVTPQGLQVIAGELSDYAAWRLTLDRVLLESPGVNWTVDYICSGKCPDDVAHTATLRGVRRLLAL